MSSSLVVAGGAISIHFALERHAIQEHTTTSSASAGAAAVRGRKISNVATRPLIMLADFMLNECRMNTRTSINS